MKKYLIIMKINENYLSFSSYSTRLHFIDKLENYISKRYSIEYKLNIDDIVLFTSHKLHENIIL